MTEINRNEIEELRRLAERATPGPWVAAGPKLSRSGVAEPDWYDSVLMQDPPDDGDDHICEVEDRPADRKRQSANALWIAACSPDRILALCDEVERLRKALWEILAAGPELHQKGYVRIADEALADSRDEAPTVSSDQLIRRAEQPEVRAAVNPTGRRDAESDEAPEPEGQKGEDARLDKHLIERGRIPRWASPYEPEAQESMKERDVSEDQPEYSQGILHPDGPVVLKDGQPLSIDAIVSELNALQRESQPDLADPRAGQMPPVDEVTRLREERDRYRQRVSELESQQDRTEYAAAAVYQAVGVLLSDTGRFENGDGQLLLDIVSWIAGNRDTMRDVERLLPFQSQPARVPENIRRLVRELVDEAYAAVPPEYADRGLHEKYLKGDCEAAGLADAAERLDRAIQDAEREGGDPA